MNTAAAPRCQSGGRGKFTRLSRRWIATLAGCLFLPAVIGAAPDEPPSWQSELNALCLSDAAVALLPRAQSTEAAATAGRLGELFRQLTARYPAEAAVRKAAGDHFWRTGDTRVATAEWEAAQALDPGDADTANALGSARLREGQIRRACEQFQRATAARPEVARYHFDLGNVLFVFRHELAGLSSVPDEAAALRGALAELRRARDLAADNMEYARAYAETFYGVPDPDWSEAFDAWERVRVLSGSTPDFALSHLARVSLRLNQPDQAERFLETIHDPQFAGLQAKLRQQAEKLRERQETRQRNSVPSPSR